MAKIVLGMGSSHSPQLQMPPPEWHRRTEADRHNPQLWYQGQGYTFPELAEVRRDQHWERELGMDTYETRWNACQKAIAHLAETLDRVSPDVCIIVGDDQHENYTDENMPAMGVYWGQTIDDAPDPPERRNPAFYYISPFSNEPTERVSHPIDSGLGRHLIESAITAGFDVAHSTKLLPEHNQGAVGHAINWVYRRLMNNEVIPNVPILLNTYYPPNQPTMQRCWDFGVMLRKAIEAWDSDKRVAIIGSGGLSHFVIEEDLDQHIIDGLKAGSEAKLTELPNSRFNSGTSEIRNWVVVGGAMAGDGLQMRLVDYVPCYRSEAGTGCAMGFAEWL
ncbi:MAG: 3-O-methylgallate 3,4-dioxygenase [Chloroflexota bacterium]|jgi:hypothetical protein|nr:3-O-methylgallate 3,4-dioxygenase [Chloroflexota bacterium]